MLLFPNDHAANLTRINGFLCFQIDKHAGGTKEMAGHLSITGHKEALKAVMD